MPHLVAEIRSRGVSLEAVRRAVRGRYLQWEESGGEGVRRSKEEGTAGSEDPEAGDGPENTVVPVVEVSVELEWRETCAIVSRSQRGEGRAC